MKALEDLKEILEDELKKISKKGDINPQELEATYKAVDILKDIETIKAMQESGEQDKGDYSQRYSGGNSYHYPMEMMPMYDYPQSNRSYNRGSYDGSSRDGGSYEGRGYSERSYDNGSYDGGSYDGRRGRDGDSDGRYSEESSYRNSRRDARGRYSRGYSRADKKEEMMKKLDEMLDKTSNQKEREAIMECMDKLED